MGFTVSWEIPDAEFLFGELSGALGDSITVLPLVVAIGVLSDFSLGMVFVGFGLFQILWGLYYGAPVSVEPMKALAALLIAGGLTTREFAFAGVLAGIVLLFVGKTRAIGRIEPYVGTPVVRGVQFAVALLLLETGVNLALGDLSLSVLAIGVVALLFVRGVRRATPLVVLGIGTVVALSQIGVPTLSVPVPATVFAPRAQFDLGVLLGATAGQLAMTVGNAAIATSLLLSEYYDADISADELATSMGVMNLLAAPLGMIPMCHGSGGVAGKYTFGARTAVANVLLGLVYGVVALVATGLVMAFPLALLGVVLVLIAAELGRTSLETDHLGTTLLVGIVSLGSNVGVGFVVGVLAYNLRRWNRTRTSGGPAT